MVYKGLTTFSEYEVIQNEESAFSRGTIWGDRVVDTVGLVKKYLRGKVLDIGCNDGLAMEEMQKLGHEVCGLDISAEKVERAKEHGLDAVHGRMEELPFEDGEFDTVFCSYTLEHSDNIEKAVAEIKRVAKRAVIAVPIEDDARLELMQAVDRENKAHYSPIGSEKYLKDLFDSKILYEKSLERYEPEYLVVFDWSDED